MKRFVCTIAAFAFCFGSLRLFRAQAQRIEKTIKANIPFEFAVGDQTLSRRQLFAREHSAFGPGICVISKTTS